MKFFNIFKWHVWKSPSGLYYVRRKNLFGYVLSKKNKNTL